MGVWGSGSGLGAWNLSLMFTVWGLGFAVWGLQFEALRADPLARQVLQLVNLNPQPQTLNPETEQSLGVGFRV